MGAAEVADRQHREAQRKKFEDVIEGFDSGSERKLSLSERLELISLAQDCVFDGNGPANLDGCFELIRWVEDRLDEVEAV